MPRQKVDTQVPTEGAECLVQGMLCRAGIPTFKAPAFRAAYDLVAINPLTKESVTIQVKSRFQTDCDRGFVLNIDRIEADFFACVFLNMGNWWSRRPDEDVRAPEFYIIPKPEVLGRLSRFKTMTKLYTREKDPTFEPFRDNWQSVAIALGIDIKKLLGYTPRSVCE